MEIRDLFDQFTRLVEGHVQQNTWEQRLTIPSHIGKGSVTRTRIRPGMEIMEVEHLNVGKTAVSVGYSNVSNFTTNFRKHYGCNPSEYLKRIDQQNLERHRLQKVWINKKL